MSIGTWTCIMNELIAWNQVSPTKRIILSRRLETGYKSSNETERRLSSNSNSSFKSNRVYPSKDVITKPRSSSEESGIVLDVSKTLSRQSTISISSLVSSPTDRKPSSSSPMLIISPETPRETPRDEQDSREFRLQTQSCQDFLHPSSSSVSTAQRSFRSSSYPSTISSSYKVKTFIVLILCNAEYLLFLGFQQYKCKVCCEEV